MSRRAESPQQQTVKRNTQTFAPQFIESNPTPSVPEDAVALAEFSGKRWVWIKDPKSAFVRGWVYKQEGEELHVKCDDNTDRIVRNDDVDKVNPPKFDKANDMAELTHLNEGSVIHNLKLRYQSDLIYTYSGLFLVAVNPYQSLPIYHSDYVNLYKNKKKSDTRPHVFATSDIAYRDMINMRENQSILVTGESGAGKTENTKKVIQYLAAVAADYHGSRELGELEQQILQANPILEAFGNAQTVRNNNSSRFGKFIRIEFDSSSQIAGANIDWYLLEKSRVIQQNVNERNYHIFYQVFQGSSQSLKEQLLLGGDLNSYAYLQKSKKTVNGATFGSVVDFQNAFDTMGLDQNAQFDILKIVAAVLHIGNIKVIGDRSDQAHLPDRAEAEKVCHLLNIPVEDFIRDLLRPKVKAGREWVVQARSASQVRYSLDALAKSLYERAFGDLVDKINVAMERPSKEKAAFIGVLDIAGFEIFEQNSFEQFCINYTNEKLQQFFNHHMFELEQEEYEKEGIEWKFIDFGQDLQPTIDLIEKSNPVGVLSCLDEDCVMPKATDKSFTDKLNNLWNDKSPKFRGLKLRQGFTIVHYAAAVDYDTSGWLDKNKDPLNENICRLLADSHDSHVASLFNDYVLNQSVAGHKNRIKKGVFRTVAQRHKEQLSSLMNQLNSTQPHFIRCIVPNPNKKPRQFEATLILDQLRCNGVLEGIRIARTGFPNRLGFAEFRSTYEILAEGLPKGFLDSRKAVEMMLKRMDLDDSSYRIGLTKVFFRAGVLAELEKQRDRCLQDIFTQFQAFSRGFAVRRVSRKKLYRQEAVDVIQKNLAIYLKLCDSPWWNLYMQLKPLLKVSQNDEVIRRKEIEISQLQAKMKEEEISRQRILEEKRKFESEKEELEDLLRRERDLALDKDEIFKRSQQRESDLSEQLKEALTDIDRLEEQCDQLMAAKHRVDSQIETLKNNLAEGARLISRLEEEKADLILDIGTLQTETSEKVSADTRDHENIAHLEEELHSIKSESEKLGKQLESTRAQFGVDLRNHEASISQKEDTIKRLKQELEQKDSGLYSMEAQLKQLTSTASSYEDMIRKKESELKILRIDNVALKQSNKTLTTDNTGLNDRNNSALLELQDLKNELNSLRIAKDQLEKEFNTSEKIDPTKNAEHESELEQTNAKLATLQANFDQERNERRKMMKSRTAEIMHLKTLLDQSQAKKTSLQIEFESQAIMLQKTKARASMLEAENVSRDTELRSCRLRIEQIESGEKEANSVQDDLERQLIEATAQSATLEHKLLDAERERTSHISQIETLKNELESFMAKSRDLTAVRQRIESEKDMLRKRLDTEEEARKLLESQLLEKTKVINEFPRVSQAEIQKTINALEVERDKSIRELKTLQKNYEELRAESLKLESQQKRRNLEIEDLSHEAQVSKYKQQLEDEKHQHSLSKLNATSLKGALDAANVDLEERSELLLTLTNTINPLESSTEIDTDKTVLRKNTEKAIDLARRFEEALVAKSVAVEGRARAEQQLVELRSQWNEDIKKLETRNDNTKKAFLDELATVDSGRGSPSTKGSSANFVRGHTLQNSKPTNRIIHEFQHRIDDQTRTRGVSEDAAYQSRKKIQDLERLVEDLQVQFKMSEVQRQRLERAQDVETAAQDSSLVRSLQRDNARLHEILNENADHLSALESSQLEGISSFRDLQSRSYEEAETAFNSLADQRRILIKAQKATVAELNKTRRELDSLNHAKSRLEKQLVEANSQLQGEAVDREDEAAERSKMLAELTNSKVRLEGEISKVGELSETAKLYKTRSEDYFGKLEVAEIAVRKATRAESYMQSQLEETERELVEVKEAHKANELEIQRLVQKIQILEAKLEDGSADSTMSHLAHQRLQNELEELRVRHERDLEERDSYIDQTRSKYQKELTSLHGELESERHNVMDLRTENKKLRASSDSLQVKLDESLLISTSWSKEKARYETKVKEISLALEEALSARRESQSEVVANLSEMRKLRAHIDELEAEREQLSKDKRQLEHRLEQTCQSIENMSREKGSASSAKLEKEILALRTLLDEKEDVAVSAIEQLRRADAVTLETQKDINAERELNAQLHRDKAQLEKTNNELHLRLVDLETSTYSNKSGVGNQRLQSQVKELEKQLAEQIRARNEIERSIRNNDRSVRELQDQLNHREKVTSRLEDEINKKEERLIQLRKMVQELQTSEMNHEVALQKSERVAKAEKERALGLERDLEKLKTRFESSDLMERLNTLRRSRGTDNSFI
ncbi:Myosin type-2 heavy chain 2 [Neolecta irregularis DAH-3]|uniref:Myosin type-2 heavy chain 2 n=1 Tax=Neolecta irregularis (strain DAH-3) TaxID=1198029 RepID=A0A1U7LSH1_NEOID|nr:Myosin type-2 heavy chain 2 [Neolecta irregularis DAH-3]|eukprot:OLL25620.1 Myosin type-2 heavy chain 2 [Neolecta irregularis DAH-3]